MLNFNSKLQLIHYINYSTKVLLALFFLSRSSHCIQYSINTYICVCTNWISSILVLKVLFLVSLS